MTEDPLIAGGDIADTLFRRARSTPDKVFCHLYRGGAADCITFAELADRSSRFATLLAERAGVAEGDVVVVILPHRGELLWTFLGAMCRGAIPSFMPFPSAKQDPAYYWQSHAELFRHIGASAVVSTLAYREAIGRHLDLPVLYVEEVAEHLAACDPYPYQAGEPHRTALLQHSSGTTGLKKGVMLTHAAVAVQAGNYARTIGLTAEHFVASWLPLYHDMGLIACFMTPLLLGAGIVMLDPFEWVARPWSILDAIERHRANFAWMPNFAFRHIVRTAPRDRQWDLGSLVALINCSEPCKPAEFAVFRERFGAGSLAPAALQVCYAMAENVFAVTQTPRGQAAKVLSVDAALMDGEGRIEEVDPASGRALLSCGPPLPETAIRILAADGESLSERRVGEIAIRSPSLFSGYNRLPELTAQKLADGWYRTGDLGFLDEGELYVTGRTDDLIVVYGRNYYAHEVEAAANLADGPIPGRVVAFGIESSTMGTAEVVVLAELRDDADPVAARRQIKSMVLDRVGLEVQTVGFLPRGRLAKSTAGKISRDRNKTQYLAERAGAVKPPQWREP